MEKRFIQFLKDEGVYDAFIHNLSHSRPGVTLEEYLLTSSYTTSLVSCAFIWYGTKEDHLFWKGIDKKWRKFCGQLTEA